jgi:general L-amino acid transport system permease protein
MLALCGSVFHAIYDIRVRAIAYQAAASACVLAAAFAGFSIVSHHLAEQNIATGFDYLNRESGFLISQSIIDYKPTDSYGRAILAGFINTLAVSCLGVILATMLGLVIGIAQLASNPLARLLARIYVETLRDVPLLLLLLFWYALLLGGLPASRDAWEILPHVFLSNGGLATPSLNWDAAHNRVVLALLLGLAVGLLLRRAYPGRDCRKSHVLLFWVVLLLPSIITMAVLQPDVVLSFPEKARFRIAGGMRLTTEFIALLVGLSLSASAAIAEIVRAGILSVGAGQRDASAALGLSRLQSMRLIIVPQALRLIVPPLTGVYSSLFKNSSLAVAIGYPDLVMVSNTIMNQTGQAIECITIYMSIYLAISLAIALFMRRFGQHREGHEREPLTWRA